MTTTQFLYMVFGGWIVLLLLLVWVLLLQGRAKPDGLWVPMLVIALPTTSAVFENTHSLWLTLAIGTMPLIGIWIGHLAARQRRPSNGDIRRWRSP